MKRTPRKPEETVPQQTSSQMTSLHSLAPRILTDEEDIKRIQPYLDALKTAIDDQNISNIALTGGYGSGKSTIIRTFQERNRGYKYLNISLASFKDNQQEDEKLERKLEISILQQIFYHVAPSVIPDSRFKRIVNISGRKLWMIAAGLILWLISAITIFSFRYIEKLNPGSWDLSKSFSWYAVPVFLIFFSGIGFFAKAVVRLFSNSKISKFNIRGELELGENIDKSVFNQHLEEILYFFERTDYNVVVIEDLDRFESTEIFTKLREINILLNKSDLISRQINFLYAVKDEMFTNKNDRVKFFEFVIPVIPFINPANAGDQLTRLIREAELEGVLSKEFTEDVVTFIDDIDMRLLINIFHEYRLYRENLSKELPQDELFAMIVYKNMFPDDFGALAKREGKLYRILSKRNDYVKELLDKTETKIQAKQAEVERIEQELVPSIRELRSIYIDAIRQKFPEAVSLHFEGEVTFDTLLEDDRFPDLFKYPLSHYKFISHPHSSGYFSKQKVHAKLMFAEIEKSVNTAFTYKEREKLIKDKIAKKGEGLKHELEKLKVKKYLIESQPLKEIFQEVNIEKHLAEFSNVPLMRNLLLNGYINEHYSDYISLFHEINITKADFEFMRKVKSGVSLPFDYRLTKVDNLIRKINLKYFNLEYILNFDLLDCLLADDLRYKDQLGSVVGVLSNEGSASAIFTEAYIDRGVQTGRFIKLLSRSWPGYWMHVSNQKYTEEKLFRYFRLIIEFAELRDIAAFGEIGDLWLYIEKVPGFLSLIADSDKIEKIIDTLDVEFESLDAPTENTRKLFDFVYENGHYRINTFMLEQMVRAKGKYNENDWKTKNYFAIKKSGCESLVGYVEENIGEYIENVYLEIESNTQEEESLLVELLNNVGLVQVLKERVIQQTETKVTDLDEVEEEAIKEKLLIYGKAKPTWENVKAYYSAKETVIDKNLVEFLNTEWVYTFLSKDRMPHKDEAFDYPSFREKIILCNELDNEGYKYLLQGIHYTRDKLTFEKLDRKKVESLIEHILTLSPENFFLLKQHFRGLSVKLIEKNKSDFFKNMAAYELDTDDVSDLLNSERITTSEKLLVVHTVNEELIVENQNALRAVGQLVLKRAELNITGALLSALLKTPALSTEQRIKIFNLKHAQVNSEGIDAFLYSLEEPYPDIAGSGKRPLIDNNKYNAAFAENLKSKNYISSFDQEKNGIRISTFRNRS